MMLLGSQNKILLQSEQVKAVETLTPNQNTQVIYVV